jgi:hypothetical protein
MEKTMKLLKYLLPFAMATCGVCATVSAAEFATVQEARERDDDAVTDFVRSKRAVSLQEKGGALMISGDVRSEWAFMHAWSHHHRQRGSGSGSRNTPPFASNEFNVEVNLMFDYKADRTWAAIQLQFDNAAGIQEHEREEDSTFNRNILWGSGSGDDLFLRKAYVGYNLADHGRTRWDLEIGRRRLYDVFDSQIQFYSIFDGLLIKYANSFEGVADLTVKAAAFVIDYAVNQFGYVGEIGLLNIGDSGFDFKYSIIDWDTHDGRNRFSKKNARGSEFLNHQFTAAYNFSPDMLPYKSKLYGAFLHNSRAEKTHFSRHDEADDAWYIGFKMGEVKRQGDWAVDLNYQWVEAQSIPEFDVSGIKRDNPRNVSFYDHRWGGFANYQGYKINGFYAVTDNWTLNAFFERVRQESTRIGGKHRSFQFEIAAIYAF